MSKVRKGHIVLQKNSFLLPQVAVYTRQELNIRVTANFLLALAAHLPNSKPHLRRYFCSAVQLPSDWLEVTRIYSTVRWEIFITTQTLNGFVLSVLLFSLYSY